MSVLWESLAGATGSVVLVYGGVVVLILAGRAVRATVLLVLGALIRTGVIE